MADSFTEYPWQYRYCTSALNRDGKPTNVLHDFYIPALQRAVRYDRVAGYFRSTSLAAASQGYTAFLKHGGTMRLVVGADLQVQDVAAILRGNKQRLSDHLMAELETPESWPAEVQNGVALLSEMVALGHLEVRVAFRVNSVTGEAISADSIEDGYVHEKWFLMEDSEGHRLYGSGSLNESHTALVLNAENVDIHCEWMSEGDRERVESAETDFEYLWANKNVHMRVLPVPDAVKQRLIQLKTLRNRPTEVDGTVLPLEVQLSPKERVQFALLRNAPRMPGGEFVGMYSAPVSPWPHQEIVSRRLIESWPYSYLMCDEVGLGKTIEAALAIRSLVLSGVVKRVLIVAPASLTEQWHRELAQKAMLPFALSRVKPNSNGKFSHTYIYPESNQSTDEKLYGPDLNIVSSGLVRRKSRLSQLRNAENFDIVLVDEAHYARRQNPREGAVGNPKYGDLYTVMQGDLRKKARALWMATATPMQIDPIEVYDLFRLTNRAGQFLSDPSLTMEYFQGLGTLVSRKQPNRQVWAMMGQSFAQIEKLDPYLWDYLGKTAITSKNRKALRELPFRDPHNADLKQLIQPLFAASPLSRVMMRHTRELLDIYKQNGQLSSNLAHRYVRPVCAIPFTEEEAEFYEMLEAYCEGLNEQIRKYNPTARQMMYFLLNFLQLRFASSFYAIQKTLERRLQRVKNTLLIGGAPSSEEELQELLDSLKNDDDDYSEGDLDEITMDALLKDRTPQDLEWEEAHLGKMLDKLNSIHGTPSKMNILLQELDRRKQPNRRLRQTVLFTRFYDSLTSIRMFLRTLEPSMRVGIYAGGNKASCYDPKRGKDCGTSHEEIKNKFLAGEIDLLLCTDAAAEGLNLQTADLLINFDLGWNPMKIEQRIGRIDRIGQTHSDIQVLNMCYLGSAEQIVYGRLLDRLQKANLIVGAQQISLLPVTQEEFRKLYTGELTPEKLEEQSIKRLRKQKEDTSSMEMSAEDMYAMYSRMSEQMRSHTYPATTEDLWTCLVNSEYLKSLGAKLHESGVWYLPASDMWNSMEVTNQPDLVSEEISYNSWGNSQIDYLLSILGEESKETQFFRLVTVPGNAGVVGLAVSTTTGVRMVTTYSETKKLEIDASYQITNEDVQQCCDQLSNLVDQGRKKKLRLQQAENMNREIAELHKRFISQISIEILKQLENSGCTKVMDAIKQLEAHSKAIYYVDLPVELFGGKASDLLFLTSESAGNVHVTVNGTLLECVTGLVKREAAAIRNKKNSEKESEDVIHRLERR